MAYPIEVQRSSGAANMGDVTTIGAQDDTVGRVARFFLPVAFHLSWVRVHFSGAATGSGPLGRVKPVVLAILAPVS